MTGTAAPADLRLHRRQTFTTVPRGRCLTVVDDPAGPPPYGTLVLAHGLTGDRSGPADLLAHLAAEICVTCQVRVVRFDMRGSGDSTGDFFDTTFDGMTDDFVAVARRHAVGDRPLVCGGISIGGVPATLGAARLVEANDVRPCGVVLLSSDLIEGVRFDVAGIAPVRSGEFHLPGAFFRERERLRPRTALVRSGLPFLFVYGTKDLKVAACAPWFATHGTTSGIDCDHLFEGSAARAQLVRECTAFVSRVIKGGP
ncbi:MAG TPA: alpha/beta fold hydrolase [Actinopolymorphaceae bacterium]|jgi:hypothetical protein